MNKILELREKMLTYLRCTSQRVSGDSCSIEGSFELPVRIFGHQVIATTDMSASYIDIWNRVLLAVRFESAMNCSTVIHIVHLDSEELNLGLLQFIFCFLGEWAVALGEHHDFVLGDVVLNLLLGSFFLLNNSEVNDLNIESERRISWDRSHSSLSVGHIGRTVENCSLALGQLSDSKIPAFDHLANSESEFEGLSAISRRIKFLPSFLQSSCVVHFDLFAIWSKRSAWGSFVHLSDPELGVVGRFILRIHWLRFHQILQYRRFFFNFQNLFLIFKIVFLNIFRKNF